MQAPSTCARALTCLLQAVEREETWETLMHLLIFTRIALAAPARGFKLKRSSSTQQYRPNCLAAVMHLSGELIAIIHRQATTDGPRTRAQSRAAAAGTAAASTDLHFGNLIRKHTSVVGDGRPVPLADQSARGRAWPRDKGDPRKVASPESLGWQDGGNRWGAEERPRKAPPVPSRSRC